MKDELPPQLTPELLLRAYAAGVFPMAESDDDREVFWVDPRERGILPLDQLQVSRRLARTFRNGDFEIRVDHSFAKVVAACAGRAETWISPEIARVYGELFRLGHAHSVEIWQEGLLTGGLYGVSLGAAFFGESMFSRARDTSKLALIALVARLNAGGFQLLDTQFVTDHLLSLGAVEIPRTQYRRRLAVAVSTPANFTGLSATADRQLLLQLATQTS